MVARNFLSPKLKNCENSHLKKFSVLVVRSEWINDSITAETFGGKAVYT